MLRGLKEWIKRIGEPDLTDVLVPKKEVIYKEYPSNKRKEAIFIARNPTKPIDQVNNASNNL